MLTGLALGYTPQGAPDFGLDRARFRAPGARYAVLLHATARPEKEWPEANWIALGDALAARGLRSGAAVGLRTPSARAPSAWRAVAAARARAAARSRSIRWRG